MRLQKLTKAWFDFDADPDKSAFEIKHLRAGEISRIVELTHKQRFEFRKEADGEMIPVPILEPNGVKESELTIIETIADWTNTFDANGVPMDCTKENKERLCRELSEEDFVIFAAFIKDKRRILSEQIKEEEKALRGN
jgi:hypothetical protein